MPGGLSHPLRDDLDRCYLDALSALGRAISSPYEPHLFLAEFSGVVQRFLPHDRMALFVFDADVSNYTVFAEHGGARDGVHDSRLSGVADPRRREPIQSWALPYVRAAQTIRLDAVDEVSLVHPDSPERRLADLGFRSLLALAFKSDGRVVGSLSLRSLAPRAFDTGSERLLTRLVDLAAPFFVCRIVAMQERWRRERLSSVRDLARILTTHVDAREAFPALAEGLKPILDYDHASIGMLASNGVDIVNYADTDSDPARPLARPGVTALEYSFDARLRRGQSVVIGDARAELDPHRAGDALLLARGLRSYLFTPILFGEKLAGAFSVGKAEPRWYGEADAEIAQSVALKIALAEHQRLLAHEETRRIQTELRKRTLEERVESLETVLNERFGFQRIQGRSRALREAVTGARKVAPTHTTVLLTGESGTGKELFARAIHAESARRGGPFVALNCAALPDALMESELFGHERGAFTGADRARSGRFEAAAGGTLFLDEVAELAPRVQAKLLRVLQEREFSPLGSSRVVTADVRLIAATNRDLRREVVEGRFREDLYYRLEVFTLRLPPLRERGDDVLVLAEQLLREHARHMGRPIPVLTPDACAALVAHPWPGNVRELSNTLERALIVGDGRQVDVAQLGLDFVPPVRPAPPARESEEPPSKLADLERRAVESALQGTHWNRTKAARELGVTRSQLYTLMKRFGIGP